jgi:hypothetical protein
VFASQVLFDSPALGDVQRPQLSSHHQPVEPTQNPINFVGKLRDKLLPGVLLFGTPFQFGCGSAEVLSRFFPRVHSIPSDK